MATNRQSLSKAAKQLSSKGAAKGGRERAKSMSPEERSAIASRAASARWSGGTQEEGLPKAVCGGLEPLRIGDVEIPCYVLEDEKRVITVSGMQMALGMAASGGSPRMAQFALQIADNPSMGNDLSSRLESPIEFALPKGGIAKGYEATMLADLCDAILEARKKQRLTERYSHIAHAAELLVRGFATVGIIALVDEATGYQYVRRRLALAELLDKYLDDKLNRWTKTFDDDYYIELFRLLGMDYENLRPGDGKPPEIGRHTKEIVYRRLHPGIVQELERSNPYVVPGRRLHKHHQWLTREMGHPVLKEHLAKIITTMKLSDDWLSFQRNLNKAVPMVGDQGFFDEFFKDD